MEESHRGTADRMRALLSRRFPTPAEFSAALVAVDPSARDAWVDAVFGLDELPEDGPDLPPGCVPYLPCGVETLLAVAARAEVTSADVVVDVGSGLGRATALLHLLTGAGAIGLEVQARLVQASRALAGRLNASRVTVIEGDAARLAGFMTIGSVFFLNCPFSGERLARVLDELEDLARARPIRVCTVDLPLPVRPWLTLVSSSPTGAVAVYRSNQKLQPGGSPALRHPARP